MSCPLGLPWCSRKCPWYYTPCNHGEDDNGDDVRLSRALRKRLEEVEEA